MISLLRILEIFSFELNENKCLSIRNLTRIIIIIYAYLDLTRNKSNKKKIKTRLINQTKKMLYKYSKPNQISSIYSFTVYGE